MPANRSAQALELAAGEAAGFLRAAAHPARLRIICALLESDCSAGDLARRAGLRAPALSQHATILEAGGLIARERVANSVRYRLAASEAAALAELLHRLFCGPKAQRARPARRTHWSTP